MHVTKAIITAAGGDQSQLPLQSVVNGAGQVVTALQLLISEVTLAGIEEIAVIVRPDQVDRFRVAAGTVGQISFIEQHEPRGYGDAILRGRDFVGDNAFLHLVGDHLYVSQDTVGCAKQLVEIASREQCAVSAVQPTRENQLPYFGVVGGKPVAQSSGLFEVERVVEKPTPTQAEQNLIVAGQRAGYYLCLFGMHVLTSPVFDLLEEQLASTKGSINLSDALDRFCQTQRHLAAQLNGLRYDIGEKYGLMIAQLAIALAGSDRDRILTELVELVARR
ncbi:MAG: sugar phosphate nucleotidyltransferase [Aureliella sp.]